jgi:hypothetical protein
MAALVLAALFCGGCATTQAPHPENAEAHEAPPALKELAAKVERDLLLVQERVAQLAKFGRKHPQDTAAIDAHARTLFEGLPVTDWTFSTDPASLQTNQEEISGEAQPARNAVNAVPFGPPQMVVEGVAIDVSSTTPKGVAQARLFVSDLIGRIAEEELSGTNVDCWVMDRHGYQIYDPDAHELGRNLLADPLYSDYPELRALVQRMAQEPNGAGAYSFLNTGLESLVRKHAHWTTVRVDDAEWRVVTVQLVGRESQDVLTLMQDMDVMWDLRSVRTLLAAPVWQEAFQRRDETLIRERFQQVIGDHPLIYNIACIYPDGIIRFGEPRENSFDNYDLNAGRIPRDADLLLAAQSGEEAWLTFALLEGGHGLFNVQPVTIDGVLAGAVYIIWLAPKTG